MPQTTQSAFIVIAVGTDGARYYYGPFARSRFAYQWADANLKGWHWNVKELTPV